MLELLQFKRDLPQISPDEVVNILGFQLFNTTLSSMLVVFLVAIASFYLSKKISIRPTYFQAMIEIIYEALIKQIQSLTGKVHAQRIFAISASVFIFIGVSNYLGLVPGVGSIIWNGVSIFRTATSDFNTAFGISLAAIIILQGVSIYDFGLWGYFNKFIPILKLKDDFKKGALSPVYIFVTILIALLDIIGEFAKVASVSLRLFGNMYAGEVLTTVLIGIFAFVLPSFWIVFGLLSAIIQTIVFGSLLAVFYTQAAGDPRKIRESIVPKVVKNKFSRLLVSIK
jgi:F-type H+-transporting ATPase subunit a